MSQISLSVLKVLDEARYAKMNTTSMKTFPKTQACVGVLYLERVLVSALLLEDLQDLAIDAQAQHLAGNLVVVCDGVLLDL